ncbi:MAG: RNA polymerase sigma factor [Tepidisphaeraceae bacterium]|jgi:RNA polymerase sigma-70 factor (ECF subfamily)
MTDGAPDFPFNISRLFPVSSGGQSSIDLRLGGKAPVDRQTFDRLVLEHLPAAQRFAVRLTGQPDAAQDVVQDALVNASRRWTTFQGRSAFKTWLFQIVVHAFRDDLERRSRRPASAMEDEPPDRRANDPAVLAASAELGRIVAAAVSNLPPRQREVMVLHTYEELNDLELAAVLDITPQNVRTTLHLARERLRQVLRPYLIETGDGNRPTTT